MRQEEEMTVSKGQNFISAESYISSEVPSYMAEVVGSVVLEKESPVDINVNQSFEELDETTAAVIQICPQSIAVVTNEEIQPDSLSLDMSEVSTTENGIINAANANELGNPKYYCQKCNKEFSRRNYAEKHCKTKLTWRCPDCFEEIVHSKNVERHKKRCKVDKISSTVTPKEFRCQYCDKVFPSKFNLQRHELKVHNMSSSVKSYTCEKENCAFSAVNEKELKRHFTLVHSDLEKIKCSKCEFSFMSLKGLQQHVLECHRLKCSQCSSTFSSSKKLSQHMHRDHKTEIDSDMSNSFQCSSSSSVSCSSNDVNVSNVEQAGGSQMARANVIVWK